MPVWQTISSAAISTLSFVFSRILVLFPKRLYKPLSVHSPYCTYWTLTQMSSASPVSRIYLSAFVFYFQNSYYLIIILTFLIVPFPRFQSYTNEILAIKNPHLYLSLCCHSWVSICNTIKTILIWFNVFFWVWTVWETVLMIISNHQLDIWMRSCTSYCRQECDLVAAFLLFTIVHSTAY